MKIRDHDVGVCSWSLQPKDTADLISAVKQTGLEHMQFAVNPLMEKDEAESGAEISQILESGLKLTATMVGFPGEYYTTIASIRRTGGFALDERWPERRDIAFRAGKLTARLGTSSLTTHIGFVPLSSDPNYSVMVDRVREVAQGLAADGVDLLMETGQEAASELLQFLNDLNCRNVGVNFDPANMILYGMEDPIDAIEILSRHIRHVHVKDAVSSSQPRVMWGREVQFGAGEVGPELLLDALDQIGYEGPLCIEREGGNDRVASIRAAVRALQEAE